MTQKFLNWLQGLIAAGDVHPFYVSDEWISLSSYVRHKLDRDECQICKERGKFRRAELVHHEKHVKKFPHLALDIYYVDSDGEKKRNLRSVCKDCHEYVCHPERLRKKRWQSFTTEERWD